MQKDPLKFVKLQEKNCAISICPQRGKQWHQSATGLNSKLEEGRDKKIEYLLRLMTAHDSLFQTEIIVSCKKRKEKYGINNWQYINENDSS